MPSTKDINILEGPVKLLLVSTTGLGKTICAAGFHKQGLVQIEDADVRMKPVAAYYPGVDISYNSYTSDNFNMFVNKIHDIIDGKFIPKFNTWVIDSVTSFSI